VVGSQPIEPAWESLRSPGNQGSSNERQDFMHSRRIASLLLITASMLAAFVLPAQAAVRHIDGTVVSKNAASQSFRITTQSGNQVRIKVTSSTVFQRIAGFGGLHKGLAVEVEAKSTSSGLVATKVETRSGGANGGGGGGGGADDGPNHT
jgi:hypothetical protein